MQTECIFCKIVQGVLPAIRVFEDELSLAFIDIGPLVKGHTLVIPKEHFDPVTAVPDKILQHLILVTRKVAQAQFKGLQADGVNIFQANGATAGQVVPHVHFHIIPRFAGDGHSWNWHAGKYNNNEEMQSLADLIRSNL